MCLLLALYFYFFLAPYCVTLYFILLIVSGLFFYLFLRCCIVLFFETLFSVSFLLSPFYVVVFSLLFFPDFSPSFEIIRPSKPSSRRYPKYLRSNFFFWPNWFNNEDFSRIQFRVRVCMGKSSNKSILEDVPEEHTCIFKWLAAIRNFGFFYEFSV